METLTLARFICELTLQDYTFVQERASRLAASCLLLALKMRSLGGWVRSQRPSAPEPHLLSRLLRPTSCKARPPSSPGLQTSPEERFLQGGGALQSQGLREDPGLC